MKSRLCYLLAAALCTPLFAGAEANESLTIERIYADPSLNGPEMRGLSLSPDGEQVTYLRAKEDNFEQLDLWAYHRATGKHTLLVDSAKLVPERELSDEEKARRERARITHSGIITYQWATNGKGLLFPLSGDLFFYDLGTQTPKQLTATEAFETDPQLSPDGTQVAFIRDQNIYVVAIDSGAERQLTFDGKGTIKNGMAEFVAQEEMGRSTGFWWSPDSQKIAFMRIDESPVGIEQRYEIEGESFKVFDQRYPRTGTANVLNKVGVLTLKQRKPTARWMDIGTETDIYIARVNWFADSQSLLIQRQNRAQTQLDMLKARSDSGKSRVLFTETGEHWVNLHDHLKFLKDQQHFIWGSESADTLQLYLYSVDGKRLGAITQGEGVVLSIEGVDEANGWVYFTANYDNPLETHLYRAKLFAKTPQVERISQRAGTHNITLSKQANTYLDNFSSVSQPTQTSYHSIDGKHIEWLEQNALDSKHPYAPYLGKHIASEFGSLKAEDGQAMYYQLIKPAHMQKGVRYPVIIDVYGGPHAQRVKNSWLGRNSYWHQFMAQRGYVVFKLDNRGSGNRGLKFETPIHKKLGDIELRDQLVGVEFLKSLPYVDAQRIGIFGWSYGGYMTAMALFKAPDVFKAGVSVAPVTDWRLYDTHYTERYLGHPEENSAGYDASNVFPYVDNYRDGLLIVHGMADDNVLFLNATKLYGALQNRMKPFEQSNYPGKKHGIRGKETRIHLFNQITEFFDRKLAPAD
ncbi:S9 family peptidase [Simiduia aestuariiviva]|uniref:Dipeptidyl-peptidase-4 n=1 Tax=Simiduia aestuariiviva TaxID=1510459 RepID=A0A839UI08_9GAMM|nr:S9 family peptidase [Simiduia aestuariiviva]MBB3167674.1 dipeptidyl-peptidase-4 [Simiduia aestuariiviva]